MGLQITVSAIPVAPGAWLSMLSPEDVRIFGPPVTTGMGSHVLILENPKAHDDGLITFDRAGVQLYRFGVTDEALLIKGGAGGIVESAPTVDFGRVYWVTVGAGRQDNFAHAMKFGVWGVESQYEHRIRDIGPGDFILFYGKAVGFALSEVRSVPFFTTESVWPDGVYPWRVAVSPSIRRTPSAEFRRVYQHLRSLANTRYPSAQAAGRAIGGVSGIFRRLRREEVSAIFRELSWT